MAFSGLSFPDLEYGIRVRNTRVMAHLPAVVASNGTFEFRVLRAAYARFEFTIPPWKFVPADRQTLLAFWQSVGGELQSFLWRDLDYGSFTSANIGTGTQLAVPGAPTVTESLSAGTLALGTYDMTVTALNAEGETTASAQTAVTLALDPPAPTLAASTAAGTLAAGTYTYGLVFHTLTGYSVLGTTGAITTTGTGEVDLSWTLPTGVTSVDVYGRVAGSLGLLASGLTGTTWTDDGSGTPGVAPPSTATVTGESTSAWSAVNGATSYNVYRANTLIGNTTALTFTDTGLAGGVAAPTINGTGTTNYPLVVPVAGALHPIWHPDDTMVIDSGGAPITGWTAEVVYQQPTIVFPRGSCPLYGDAVTATGTFSFAVRFKGDLTYVLMNAAQPSWGASAMDAITMVEVFE